MALLSAAFNDPNPGHYETANFISRFMTHYIAAVYATSVTFLSVIERLIQNPDVIVMLRKEAKEKILNPGNPETWTKAEVDQLEVHDSFIRECMRTTPVAYATMRRSVMSPKGYNFSDGTFVPSTFEVGVPVNQVHKDERLYKNASAFNPLRFMERLAGPVKTTDHAGNASGERREQLASTTTSFLAWGDGSHAW